MAVKRPFILAAKHIPETDCPKPFRCGCQDCLRKAGLQLVFHPEDAKSGMPKAFWRRRLVARDTAAHVPQLWVFGDFDVPGEIDPEPQQTGGPVEELVDGSFRSQDQESTPEESTPRSGRRRRRPER